MVGASSGLPGQLFFCGHLQNFPSYPEKYDLACISMCSEPRRIIIHSAATVITSNKHNYSRGLHSQTLDWNVTPSVRAHTLTQTQRHRRACVLFASAPCSPRRLLVHSDQRGAEAQRWHVLTVLHLISGCCAQMGERAVGRWWWGGGERGSSPELSAGMISSGRRAAEHRPAFLAVYPHACVFCVFFLVDCHVTFGRDTR